MKIPDKKLKNGFKMPVYGIGTWGMGGEQDLAALKRALDLGVSHIDTAELYGAGHAEELVGQAIRNYPRENIFIVSKVKPENLNYNGVISAARASLKRLATPYLDLYLIHWPTRFMDLKGTMRAMDDLLSEDLIRNIGVSNFEIRHLEEAQSYTKNKIVNNQVHYSLTHREPEENGVLEFCQKNDILLTAYTPLDNGALARSRGLLAEIAQKYAKTPAQTALNWLIYQKNVVAIAKTSQIEHLEENLGAIDWELEKEDFERLSSSPNRGG